MSIDNSVSSDEDDIFLPKSNLDEYPLNRNYFTPLDAVDIKKTSQSLIALLYCDSVEGYGKTFRFYMWRKRKDVNHWWNVNCNFPADDNIAMFDNLRHMIKFVKKYKGQ